MSNTKALCLRHHHSPFEDQEPNIHRQREDFASKTETISSDEIKVQTDFDQHYPIMGTYIKASLLIEYTARFVTSSTISNYKIPIGGAIELSCSK